MNFHVTVRGDLITSSNLRAHKGDECLRMADELDADYGGTSIFPTLQEAIDFAAWFHVRFPEGRDRPTIKSRRDLVQVTEEDDESQEDAERRGGYGGGTL